MTAILTGVILFLIGGIVSIFFHEKLKKVAFDLNRQLKEEMTAEFDDAGNIGKMYRRQDEIGTPFCVTVDYKTIEDQTVTIRDRDSMKQERIPLAKVFQYVYTKL